jgi:NAD(P)-dependent dehydrogenase (short-subunit alcohol dehydrogenase family)
MLISSTIANKSKARLGLFLKSKLDDWSNIDNVKVLMMGYTIQGKTVLVTGANRGIGEAIVLALVEQGAARIYAGARDLGNLQHLVAQAPNIIVPVQLDVTKASDIAAVAQQLGSLDLLINNAGIATGSNFSGEASLSIAQSEMATNYFGVINLTHALLPVLRKSSAAAVVNVSSIAGIANFPTLGPYSATKAAVHSFTQGLRAELRSAKIAVVGVYPGPVETRLTEGFEMDKATPANVALAILSGVEAGAEDIFPDAFSQAMYQVFVQNPKQLEQQFSAMLG